MDGLHEQIISALFHKDTVGVVLSGVEREDLTDALTQDIFTAVKELFDAGVLIEPLAVTDKLSHIYGNANEISKLCHYYSAVTPVNLDYCIQTLLDKSRLRKIKDISTKLIYMDKLEDAENLISELSLLSAPKSKGTFQTAHQAADAFADALNYRVENGVSFIPWGIVPLDFCMHTRRGNFVVIGARPSTGKSAFALQTALRMASAGYRTGIISLEMSAEEISERCISHLSGVSLGAIAKGKLTDEELKYTYTACGTLSKLPIGFDYSARTVAQIKARALSERWDVILLDYIQLVNSGGKASRYEAVTKISQELQQLAHQNSILLVALSQLSRPQTTADGKEKRPSLTDLRESGQIEQDADAVILMSLADSNDKDSDRYVQLAKNRQGRCADFVLRFDGDKQTFMYGGANK